MSMSISRTCLLGTVLAIAYAAGLLCAPQARAMSCVQPADPAAVLTGHRQSDPFANAELKRRPMYVIDGVLLSVREGPSVKHRDGDVISFMAGLPDPRIATVLVLGTSWGNRTHNATPTPPLITRITLQSVFAQSLRVGDRFLADVRRTPAGWRVDPCAAFQPVTTALSYPHRRSISQLLGLATKH